MNKFKDKYQVVGDIWTNIRGFELFLFHYQRRTNLEPICNPWRMNLGKIAIPNVFMDVELVKFLAKHYNSNLKAICDPQGKPFVQLSRIAIEEVFSFKDICDHPILYEELRSEYWRLDTTYKGWRLPLY